MAPNSRPPLTSRIRASFEGRRKSFEGARKLSKSGRTSTADSNTPSQDVVVSTGVDSDISSPLHTTGFIAQDPESIRNAVDQAINGEAFQLAIAANLAKLIKPSIKSALDTIQPVIEAVYSHELLLRKTNQSVEDVLSRMDTNAETEAARRESMVDVTYVVPGSPAEGERSSDAGDEASKSRGIAGFDVDQFKRILEEHTAKTLATISESIESNNTKIEGVSQEISGLSASIGPTKESIDSLKLTSEQGTTSLSDLQAQLDQLKADIGQIIEAIGTDLGRNVQAISEKSGAAPDVDILATHSTKLDQISSDLAAMRSQEVSTEKLDVITTEIGVLKASVEAGTTASAQGFTDILAAVGEQSNILSEIKEKEPHPDILAALQQSNESHALHTAALTEIKDRSVSPATATPDVSEGGSTVDHSPVLQMIQTDLNTLKENIAIGFSPDGELSTKIGSILTTIEQYKTEQASAEILAAVKQSNESHLAHAAALEGLKSTDPGLNPELESHITGIVSKLDEHTAALENVKTFGETHTAALEGIKLTPPDSVPFDTTEMTEQLAGIISKLEAHTTALDEIKELGCTPTEPTPHDTSDITAQLSTLTTKLDSHTVSLDEIKDLGSSHATALESHAVALDSIKSGPTEIASINIDGITAQFNAIDSKLDEHASVLNELKEFGGTHAAALGNHGTTLESIKSLNVSAPEGSDEAGVSAQIAAVVTTLEKHSIALDEIKMHTTALESHGSKLDDIKTLTSAHATALDGHGSALEGIKSLSVGSTTESTNSVLESQVSAIIATLASHSSILHEIQTSGGTHVTTLESHGAALESLKSTVSSLTGDGTGASELDGKIEAIISTLESHSATLSDINSNGGSHSSVLDEIKSLATAHAVAIDNHGTSLEEMKSRSIEEAPTDTGSAPLQAHLTSLVATLEAHTSALGEIQASTNSHSLVLEEIKNVSTIYADTLEDLRSPGIPVNATADPMNLAALEIQVGSIISTLESHSAAWNEIKARNESISSAIITTDSTSGSETADGPLTDIVETLKVHTFLLNEIKEDVSAEILTALHDMGQVQANHSNLLTEIREADLDDEILTLLHASGESHTSNAATLERIHAAVALSNESHSAHASSLDELKTRSVEPVTSGGDVPNIDDLKEKISGIAEKLEECSGTLFTIKDATESSNVSHAAHTSSLAMIQSKLVDVPADGGSLGALESNIGGIVSKLDEHTAILSSIKDATSDSNASHTAHATMLSSINDATKNLTDCHTSLAAEVGEIKEKTSLSSDSHASHAVILGEIKDITVASKELHTANDSSLSELKEATSKFHENHTAAFAEFKSIQPISAPPSESIDLSGLEANITVMLNTLEGHATTLSTIKESTTTSSPEILAAIQASHELLTAHGPLLESIKEGSSNASLLANISELKDILEESKAETASHGAIVKDLHTDTKESHSNLVSAIGAIALGGAAGAGATALLSKDDEPNSFVLDEVKAVRTLIETSTANFQDTKDRVSSLASQIETNHAAILTNFSTLGDEVKVEINASGTGIAESITALHGDVKAIDVSPLPVLSASITQHGTDLKNISTQLETLDGSIKETGSHVTALHSGVHLNNTGVQQLKEHVVSHPFPSLAKGQTAMSEGVWFGSARSGSRSPTLSRVVSRSVPAVPEIGQEVSLSTEDNIMKPEKAVDPDSPAPQEREISTDGEDEVVPLIESTHATPEKEAELQPVAHEHVVAKESVDVSGFEEAVETAPEVPEENLALNKPDVREPLHEPVDDVLPSIEEPIVEPGPACHEKEESGVELVSEQCREVATSESDSKVNTGLDAPKAESAGELAIMPSPGPQTHPVNNLEQPTSNIVSRVIDEEVPSNQNPNNYAVDGDSHVQNTSTELDEPIVEETLIETSTNESESDMVEEPIVPHPLVEEISKDVSVDVETSIADPIVEEDVVESSILAHGKSVTRGNASVQEDVDQDEPEPKQDDRPEHLHEDVRLERLIDSISASPHNDEPETDLPVVSTGSLGSVAQADNIIPHPFAVVRETQSELQDASWPLPTSELADPSSPFVESPDDCRGLNEPSAVPSLLPSNHQSFLGDRDLESGHATPRDEAQTNPFDDSDHMLSPTSAFSTQSVLSPEAEVNAPQFPIRGQMDSINERGFGSPDSDAFPAPPTFPVTPGTGQSIVQRYDDESDGVISPTSEYSAPIISDDRPRTPGYTIGHDELPSENFAPPPTFPIFPSVAQQTIQGEFDDSPNAMSSLDHDESILSDMRPRTPVGNVEYDDSISRAPRAFAPPPTFPTFPTATPQSFQRFEDSDDVMSPSSEYDEPVFTNSSQRNPLHSQPTESSLFTPAPSFPVFPEPPQHTTQQRFEGLDDPMSPASEYDAHELPRKTQESPIQSRQFETSPQFDRQPPLQLRGLQRESSFDYPQENYEPALLPRNFSGQVPAFEEDEFTSPSDGKFGGSDARHRSPLRPLEDDDFRSGQYEYYSPEPLHPSQRSPVETQHSDNRSEINFGFPVAGQRSPSQHSKNDQYRSYSPQRYSPEPESSFPDHRQRSPSGTQRFDDHSELLPTQLLLDEAFPDARQLSPVEPFANGRYPSPSHERYSPEPEPLFSARRQHSRDSIPPAIATLPAHLQLDTPPFRAASPIDPYHERDAEIVSPSSEFAVPITPVRMTNPGASKTRNPFLPSSDLDYDDEEEPIRKSKAIASPGPMSPELGSPAQFSLSRNEVDSDPDSALASPTSPTSPTSPASPTFSEGGTMAEKSSGRKKKGKKEKEERNGGKKAKKEKVPFEMDGEDLE